MLACTTKTEKERRPNIVLVECRMEHKIKAGCWIREILRLGYGKKIFWRDRDELILIGGMRDSSEIDDSLFCGI